MFSGYVTTDVLLAYSDREMPFYCSLVYLKNSLVFKLHVTQEMMPVWSTEWF